MIAMALVCEPKLLIADEPTTALDVTIQAQILDLIDDLRERLRMAVILITHDMGVIAGRTDRVVVMYAGKIAEEADHRRALQPHAPPLLRGAAGLGAQARPGPRGAAAEHPGPAARPLPVASRTAASRPAASYATDSAGPRTRRSEVAGDARRVASLRLLPPGRPRACAACGRPSRGTAATPAVAEPSDGAGRSHPISWRSTAW